MHAYSICLLAAVLFGTLVGALNHNSRSRFHHHSQVSRRSIANKTYSLDEWYQGEGFFDEWSFFTGPDPTNGNVNYVDEQDALSKGLASVAEDGTLTLAVDSKSSVPAGGNRDSVRISSNKDFDGGLFIIDAIAMPVGCGTWPAFWTTGPNWPQGGEIDIVEGTNNQKQNQMTLHSGVDDCKVDTRTIHNEYIGQLLHSDCYSTQTDDSGCSIQDPSVNSFGHRFNHDGGGVFAMLWDATIGIHMWSFSRAKIPEDITNGAPTPSNWGTPSGFWSAQTCNISDHFYQHTMVIDTTICGGWAGGTYSKSGCPGTCEEAVADASNFVDAKWKIKYVAVYQ